MLAIGVSESIFWTLNPVKLKPYIEGKRKKDIEQDYFNWMLGAYIKSSVLSALDKRNKYPEKPYLEKAEEERIIDGSELSEEEKEIERRKIMAMMGFDTSMMEGGN